MARDLQNKLEYNKRYTKEIRDKYDQRLGDAEYFQITCRETGKQFFSSGKSTSGLTQHLKSLYPDLQIPTKQFYRMYYLKNDKMWHELYFDFKPIDPPKVIKCECCDWTTEDLKNLSGAYTSHLKNIHGLTEEEYIKKFPEQHIYFNKHNLRKQRKKELSEKDNYLICLECGQRLKSLTNTHLAKHGMSPTEYKLKHNIIQTTSPNLKDKNRIHWEKNLKDKAFAKISKAEVEILNLISEDLDINVETSNRSLLKGKELDLLIPSLNLAIEFNGNKWHTEVFGKKDRNYHLNKTTDLNELGYNVIQIFEDEWEYKRDIVIKKIQHIINKSEAIKLGARQCTLKVITNTASKIFLDKNHIQGGCNSTVSIGAYYKDKLVAVMCFNDKRSMTNSETVYDYDLVRFATNIKYTISGIGSKLFKYFVKNYNPESIVSFADRRWSFKDNNVYEKLEFVNDGFVKPNYWYYKNSVDRYKRFHKFGYGLSSLKKKKMYIEGMSEWECMQHHGWDRIWDCGLIRYVWRK